MQFFFPIYITQGDQKVRVPAGNETTPIDADNEATPTAALAQSLTLFIKIN